MKPLGLHISQTSKYCHLSVEALRKRKEIMHIYIANFYFEVSVANYIWGLNLRSLSCLFCLCNDLHLCMYLFWIWNFKRFSRHPATDYTASCRLLFPTAVRPSLWLQRVGTKKSNLFVMKHRSKLIFVSPNIFWMTLNRIFFLYICLLFW